MCPGQHKQIKSKQWLGNHPQELGSSVVDPDPELFAGSGSGVGSGINHFGSGSGQPLSGMNLKQNFSDKIHNFSTKCKTKIL